MVKIVADGTFSSEDRERLRSSLAQRVGSDMAIDIQMVDSIPRTNAGKYRWVISKVPLPV